MAPIRSRTAPPVGSGLPGTLRRRRARPPARGAAKASSPAAPPPWAASSSPARTAEHRHYSYHSCNDRHCPQCGGQDADQWLAANARACCCRCPTSWSPSPCPKRLRRWMRSHPQSGWTCSSPPAPKPSRTWRKTPTPGRLPRHARRAAHLEAHARLPSPRSLPGPRRRPQPGPAPVGPQPPEVPAPRPSPGRSLPHALPPSSRTAVPEAFADLPARVWKHRWVVHSAAGPARTPLRYLSRYVFKTATGNRHLQLLPDGRVRWPYRDSTTGAWPHLDLEPFELLRRFLQHVLPAGFHRVRRFGWLHPAGRAKLNRVRALLHRPAQRRRTRRLATAGPAADSGPGLPAADAALARALRCPHCGQPWSWAASGARDLRARGDPLRAQRCSAPPDRLEHGAHRSFASPCLRPNLRAPALSPVSLLRRPSRAPATTATAAMHLPRTTAPQSNTRAPRLPVTRTSGTAL